MLSLGGESASRANMAHFAKGGLPHESAQETEYRWGGYD